MKKKIIMGMAVLATVCSVIGTVGSATTVSASVGKPQTETTAAKKKAKASKAKVVDSYAKSGSYKDDCGNKLNYDYRIPKFNANTKNAKELNKTIEKTAKKIINAELKNMKSGCTLGFSSVSYKVYSKGNQVSIFMTAYDECDYHLYFAWTYNFKKDKKVTNKSLVKQAGYTEKNFIKLAKKKSANKSRREANGLEIESKIKIAMKAVNMDMPMYINQDGKLCVMVPVASGAGADFYLKKFTF